MTATTPEGLALLDARTAPETIAALWAVAGHSGDPPAEPALCVQVDNRGRPDWECPREALTDAGARLHAFATAAGGAAAELPPDGWCWGWSLLPPDGDAARPLMERPCGLDAWGGHDAFQAAHRAGQSALRLVAMHPNVPRVCATLTDVQTAWAELTPADRPRHPLAPILAAWADRPRPVQAETRRDRRLVPVQRAPAEVRETRPERQRGMLFGLADGRQPNASALPLPLFPEAPAPKSVPILDLADASGVPVMARGRGVPLAARLFVSAGLAVAPDDRRHESVRMAVSVAELREALYPNNRGPGRRSMGQLWPRMRAVLATARDYTIRLPPGPGRPHGSHWWMLALRELPDGGRDGTPDPEAVIVLDVALPPGTAADGPPVSLPDLGRLSLDSAPRWRAYIAAHALAWIPGRTRVPVPGTRKQRWGWSRDADAYPVLTADDLRRLAFGPEPGRHRTLADVISAWNDLPGLATLERQHDARTGEVGIRVIPEAARRLRNGADGGD